MPSKKDAKGGAKQPQKTPKKKEGSGGGKAKNWSKGKVQRLKVRGSLARRTLIELQQKGLIKQVVQHRAHIYKNSHLYKNNER
ncbi:hypothetical protein WA026_007508 [Henosepilachna vigintioctopunctata]|uniref:40S ribosomal protein S25 n=1 Tax=Henosepilachna vigintioctopunctata TaxID=420089 RepID=A0AAW1UM33_9CUCU